MEDRHLVVIYCRFKDDNAPSSSADDYSKVFPRHVLNRMKKAKEAFSRLAESHADDEFIKVLLFGAATVNDLKKYAVSLGLPEERIETHDCRDIADMVKKVWKRIKVSDDPPRVYFVLSNWQWMFIEPLLALKDERFRFYMESAVDDRPSDEIELDKGLEKVAKIELRESRLGGILDKVGSSVGENMKG